MRGSMILKGTYFELLNRKEKDQSTVGRWARLSFKILKPRKFPNWQVPLRSKDVHELRAIANEKVVHMIRKILEHSSQSESLLLHRALYMVQVKRSKEKVVSYLTIKMCLNIKPLIIKIRIPTCFS